MTELASKNSKNLIWLDLEMTGLDPDNDRILEIATIVTDSDLTILAEGPVFAIHQAAETLAGMNDWNTEHHTQSGLVARVQNSDVIEAMAEQQTIDFLKQYLAVGESPLCGNSICQDRRFLFRYMPDLCKFFHYRHIDVSTLKELALRWSPTLEVGFAKHNKHIALDDIKESIEELKYYRKHFIAHNRT